MNLQPLPFISLYLFEPSRLCGSSSNLELSTLNLQPASFCASLSLRVFVVHPPTLNFQLWTFNLHLLGLFESSRLWGSSP